MTYTIGEFSRLTNLGIHTLRFYEKEELLAPQKLVNGRRCYTDEDYNWISFIKRLKDTGMPLKEIREYAILRARGDSTLVQRMELLIHHKDAVEKEIMQLHGNLERLKDKILFYQSEIEKRDLMNQNIKDLA